MPLGKVVSGIGNVGGFIFDTGKKIIDPITGEPTKVDFDPRAGGGSDVATPEELFGPGAPGLAGSTPAPPPASPPPSGRFSDRPRAGIGTAPTNPTGTINTQGPAGLPVAGSLQRNPFAGQAPPGQGGAIVSDQEAAAARQTPDATAAQQAELARILFARAQGTAGPSAAEATLRQGTEDAIRQQIAASTAQTGVSAGAALRQGQQAGIGLQRQAVAEGAALRAQEQQQATQDLSRLLTDQRSGDIQQASLATRGALESRALELQELGITGKQATDRMALDLQETLANRGFAVDLEKLRATTELAMSGMDLQVALANAGFDAAQSGAILQLVGSLGGAAIGAA